VGEPVVRYVPRRDATPEGELNALASIYRFLLKRHAEKAADDSRLESEGGADEALRTEPELKVIGKHREEVNRS
jgi:hypothetical protein